MRQKIFFQKCCATDVYDNTFHLVERFNWSKVMVTFQTYQRTTSVFVKSGFSLGKR